MSVRLLVLGTIDQFKVAHGYIVYRSIITNQSMYWAQVKPGSIYHAISQLEKEGYIQNVGTRSSGTGPSRTAYSLSETGRGELLRLIEESLLADEQQRFAAGLAFMYKLPRARVLMLMHQRLARYKEGGAFMHGLPKDASLIDVSKNPEIINSWTALFDATIGYLEDFIRSLEAHKYTFVDDK